MTAELPTSPRLGPDLILHSSFPATSDAVSDQIAQLSETFTGQGLSNDLLNAVTLVLAEVLNNIVEHALAEETGTEIDLSVIEETGSLVIETTDRGRPLPPDRLSGGELPNLGTDINDLPEGGFGWFIIHALVDDMTYERHEGANRLSFSFAME